MNLKEEIGNKIEKLWSVKTSYFSNEKYDFDDCVNDIIDIFQRYKGDLK